MRRWGGWALTVVLGAITTAGLFAASTNDLRQYAPIAFSAAWLVPGLVAVGVVVAVIISDGIRGAAAMAAVACLGSLLYGAAIAAPGTAVPEIQTTLMNNGTVQGLGAFLLTLIFGMIGVVGSLVARSYLGRGDL